MDSCAAYGQTTESESASHYETVKSQDVIYDNCST